jgi:hypothetical protein
MILEGSLDDVGLVDLLRLVAREGRSGELRITVDDRTWRFDLESGRVLGCRREEGAAGEAEPCDAADAVALVARHRRGAFRLTRERAAEAPAAVDGAGREAEELARRGDMALVDFLQRLEAAGGEASLPRRDRFPTARQMEALGPAERTVYALVNGERTLAELIQRSRLDPSAVLDALGALQASSLVVPEPPASASRPFTPGGARGPRGGLRLGGVRDWLVSLAPLAALAILAVWVHGGGRAEVAEPFVVRRAPLAEAQARFALRRVRTALDAFRFAEGRWPERLEELVASGYAPADALADARGRPYYYSRKDDGFVLLAPER